MKVSDCAFVQMWLYSNTSVSTFKSTSKRFHLDDDASTPLSAQFLSPSHSLGVCVCVFFDTIIIFFNWQSFVRFGTTWFGFCTQNSDESETFSLRWILSSRQRRRRRLNKIKCDFEYSIVRQQQQKPCLFFYSFRFYRPDTLTNTFAFGREYGFYEIMTHAKRCKEERRKKNNKIEYLSCIWIIRIHQLRTQNSHRYTYSCSVNTDVQHACHPLSIEVREGIMWKNVITHTCTKTRYSSYFNRILSVVQSFFFSFICGKSIHRQLS